MAYPSVIGITGKMGSGKDTIGDILEKNHGYSHSSLAHELRKEVHEALWRAYRGFPGTNPREFFPVAPLMKYDTDDMALRAFQKIVSDFDQRHGASFESTVCDSSVSGDAFGVWKKPTSPDMRILLQWWGTEYRRREDEDYWIKKWFAAWWPKLKLGHRVSICDIRYDNEASFAKMIGELWKVEGRAIVNEGIAGHASEMGVTVEPTVFLANAGTLEYLEWLVSKGVE